MYTKDKNIVWNQYTLFDSPRFIHSDCGSSPAKTYAKQSNIAGRKTVGSNQQLLDYSPNAFLTELCREIYSVGFKLLLNSAIVS